MLDRSAGTMAIAMVLCFFTSVVLLGGVDPYFALPTVGLLLVLSAWRILALWTSPKPVDVSGRFYALAVVSFVAYVASRYGTSIPKHEAREELISVLVAALVTLTAPWALGCRQRRTLFVYSLMGLAIAQSVYGAWQAFSKATTVLFWERPEIYDGRGSGTYVCPNHLAGFFEMALALVTARAVLLRSECKSIERSTILKVVTVYGAVMIAGGLVITLSRGGWISGAVGLGVLLLLGGRGMKNWAPRLAVVGAIIVCAAGFLWSVDPVRNYLLKTVSIDLNKQQVTIGDLSMGGRVQMWKGTVPLIQKNPVFGNGIGTWRWEFQKHHSPVIFSFPEYTHNDYLNLAADYGLIGVVLMLLVFGAFAHRAFKVIRSTKSTEERAFAVGGVAAVASLLVHSFFDFNLHILANSTLLAGIMGMVVGIPINSEVNGPVKGDRVLRVVLSCVVTAMALGLGWLYYPALRGYHEFQKGNSAKAALNYTEALARYDAAVRLDPAFAKPLIRSGDILKDQASWRLGPGKIQERKELAAKAVGYYRRALELNPLHTEVWIRNAQSQAMAGDSDGALASFRRAIEIAPVNAYAHFSLGRFYNEQGDEKKALESLQKANDLYFHTEPMFFMNAVEAEERLRAKMESPK